jgi:hypothetical protein
MKNKNKNLLIATGITIGILGGYWVYAQNQAPKAECIDLYVDYGVLSKATPDNICITADKKTNALTLLSKTSYKFEYIDFGGDLGKAICTVDKLPKLKSCATMDWTSYWGVFEKHGSNNLNVASHWNMSQKGISYIQLNPGDSLGLVYLDKGKVRYPDDNTN